MLYHLYSQALMKKVFGPKLGEIT